MDIDFRQQLNVLVHLANIDDSFVDEEKELIRRLGLQNGLDKEEIEHIMDFPQPIELNSQISFNQKFEIIYNCVKVLLADGIIYQSEIDFCADVAERMGFSKDVIQFVADRFKHSKDDLRSYVYALPYAS